MYILKLFMSNRIRFILPIRKSKYVVFSCRKGGRIFLKKHVSLNENVHLSATQNAILEIGNYSGVGDNCVIVAREKIIIGDNVMIGPNVCIYDHDHVYKTDNIMREAGYISSPIIIEDNVWLGAGAVVLKGVRIGSGSVIAAGTVVNKSIPANSVVYREGKLIIKEKF